MANLLLSNRHNLRINVNYDEYWDFYINKDEMGQFSKASGNNLYTDCLISNIDLSNDECYSDSSLTIYSESEYYWENAVNNSVALKNIGYTGIDNGLITYRKDRISNMEFYNIFTNSEYDIESGDTRLTLHAVSGNTLKYDYPLSLEDGSARLNGGFFQGFYMTKCDEYAVLPNFGAENATYHFEFDLKKCDLEPESTKTLNDSHPDNKGIFFFVGTRAENKFTYWYDTTEDDCYELGVDDFVEDGEISKSDYLINNFSDTTIEFSDQDIEDINENIENYYKCPSRESENISIDGYLDYEDIDDGSEDYYDDDDDEKEDDTPVVSVNRCLPFFRWCGMPCNQGKKKQEEEEKKKKQEETEHPDPFLNNYDWDYIDLLDFATPIEYSDDTEYVEPEIDISNFAYETDNGLNISEANQYYFKTDNKFLLFDRTKSGYQVKNWVEGTQLLYYGKKHKFTGNLFLLMNRTPTGYTVKNIDQLIEANDNDYDVYSDDYNNALAFRITDEGAIGYRFLTIDCSISGDDKTTIEEGYSLSGIIKDCEWQTVNVRMDISNDKMKFMFYVDGKLVYVTKWMTKLNLRALNDLYEKQEGVPYNISLGGGSQGLCDTVQANYMLEANRVYPIEEYFAGTFIGYIRNFRIYDCSMESMSIENNFLFDSKNGNN